MQLSTEGLELIKRSEGFRSQVYRDVAGFLTIGYGHRLAEGETFAGGITEAQAAAILGNDAQQAERAVSRLVKVVDPGGFRRIGRFLLQPRRWPPRFLDSAPRIELRPL